jgi:hypothetical protein
MSGDRAQDPQTFFRITDAHAIRITELEKIQLLHAHQIKGLELSNSDVCLQLKATDTRVMESQRQLNEKVDILIAKENRREGAAGLAKWFPILIQCAVGLAALIAIFDK